jgi:hypothetical protein
VEPVRVEDERSSDQVAGVEGLEDGEDVFQWLISPVSTETFYEAIHGGAGWRGGACVCENVGSEGVSQEHTARNEAASPQPAARWHSGQAVVPHPAVQMMSRC